MQTHRVAGLLYHSCGAAADRDARRLPQTANNAGPFSRGCPRCALVIPYSSLNMILILDGIP